MHGLRLRIRPYDFSIQIDYFANRAQEAPMKLRPDSLSLRLALVTGAKLHGVIAGLVPAISIRMARCQIIGMAGTSPAMTKWKPPRVCPSYQHWGQLIGMPPNRSNIYLLYAARCLRGF